MTDSLQNKIFDELFQDDVLNNTDLSTLQNIISAKAKCKVKLTKITEKVDAHLAMMIQNQENNSLEFEALQKAETAAAEQFDRAVNALVNYKPSTPEEYGQQALALVDSLISNAEESSFAYAIKRGATLLSEGELTQTI